MTHQHPPLSEQQIQSAENVWRSFTLYGKWSAISVCVVLAILGIVFIDW